MEVRLTEVRREVAKVSRAQTLSLEDQHEMTTECSADGPESRLARRSAQRRTTTYDRTHVCAQWFEPNLVGPALAQRQGVTPQTFGRPGPEAWPVRSNRVPNSQLGSDELISRGIVSVVIAAVIMFVGRVPGRGDPISCFRTRTRDGRATSRRRRRARGTTPPAVCRMSTTVRSTRGVGLHSRLVSQTASAKPATVASPA